MSERYSLRATPRKVERPDFVETPRPRRTRKSVLPDDDDSSATDSANTSSTSRTPARKTMAPKSLINGLEEPSDGTTQSQNGGSSVNGDANGKTKGKANGKAKPNVVDGWQEGTDPKIDYSGSMEFGGSVGVASMMVLFPVLMWYMWIGATYYDGHLPTREPGQTMTDFLKHLANLVYTGAFPTLQAWKIYWAFYLYEMALYCLLPGPTAYGKPLLHDNGKQLAYHCSAVASFYTTIVTAAVLHFTKIFPLYTVLDEFGPIMSVAIISGFLVAIVAYISAIARGAQHRMTGYFFYDFFMGAELNPRMFGVLDFKMFYEVRVPWYLLFGLACATAARQFERYGYVSGEAGFLVMVFFLYANACSKGEELIVTTWDMYYEKWGFMLIFWNLAGVPFSYCHCILYIANNDPSTYKWNRYALTALYAAYLFVYWIWDTTNSQKNRFRSAERGTLLVRKTFPQLPWQTVKNPRVIKTSTGNAILADGWYGYARKIHYTCDLFFALTWGGITGFRSPFPWFYSVFFAGMIVHRAMRDIERCREKYGDAWTEYEKLVPYLFIPYVY